jgi:hypothetical protein
MSKTLLALCLGLLSITAQAKPIAVTANSAGDAIVLLDDVEADVCPKGTRIAVAKPKTGTTMAGCWMLNEDKVVIFWLVPMFLDKESFEPVTVDAGA